jgi:hypothetical protein
MFTAPTTPLISEELPLALPEPKGPRFTRKVKIISFAVGATLLVSGIAAAGNNTPKGSIATEMAPVTTEAPETTVAPTTTDAPTTTVAETDTDLTVSMWVFRNQTLLSDWLDKTREWGESSSGSPFAAEAAARDYIDYLDTMMATDIAEGAPEAFLDTVSYYRLGCEAAIDGDFSTATVFVRLANESLADLTALIPG